MNTQYSLSCAALALVLGCDVGVADQAAPPPEQVARSAPGANVAAMAADPVYLAYLAASTQRAGTMLKKMIVPAVQAHGSAGPQQVFHRWADDRKALISVGIDPDEATNADAPLLTAVTGVKLSQIATTIGRVEDLDARFGFLSMSPEQHATAVAIAMSDPQLADLVQSTWGDESVLVELGADQIDACVLECVENSAESFFIASSLAYAIAEAFEALDIDLIFIAMEGALLAVNAVVYQQCIDECGSEIEEECDADSDCDNKEYCDRGWLTIGRNQCVFSRDESEGCTRHEQCESGCCRLHAWTSPFHPVCRPSDKCD